ncbi:MAG: hypothetical protein K1X82_03135 [Bacteroidia bacterium]|nr:hypothetical protein [Bacteroidia bacterium]
MKRLFFASLAIVGFTSCQKEFEKATPSAGTANFSSYVAYGGSMAAGFADGALSKEGQEASYPNLLAQQFKLAGGSDFSIPYLKGSLGVYPDYDAINNNYSRTLSMLTLQRFTDCEGNLVMLPKRLALSGDNELDLNDNSQKIANPSSPYQHWGIPAFKMTDLLAPSYGELSSYTNNSPFSPFFWRMVQNSFFTNVLFESLKAQPTFYTIDLGTSDVLSYATEGGNGKVTDKISSLNDFTYSLNALVDSLTARGALGVMANIPDITVFPYITRIKYDDLELTEQSRVDALNSQYSGTGMIFKLGKNPFVIKDGNTARFITAEEHVTLKTPVDSLKCAGWGAEKPLNKEYILTPEELNNIRTATEQFNSVLLAKAEEKGIPVVDIKKLFETIFNHTYYDGIEFSGELVSGAFFSLDGLHPSKRGQAIVANEFIRVINESYKANIPSISVGATQGIKFP